MIEAKMSEGPEGVDVAKAMGARRRDMALVDAVIDEKAWAGARPGKS
jgi:hypothetical protein